VPTLAASGAVLLALGVGQVAQAATFTVFNTGVANDSSVLADGSVDSHYTIIASVVGPSNAFAVAANPDWIPNSSTSKWIGPTPDAGSAGIPGGNFTYRTTFDLSGLNPTTAVLQGNFASDNTTTDILINGISTGITNPSEQFSSFTPFSITSGFANGINTLDFVVTEEGGTPSGLRTEFTQATASTAVPEPSSALGTLALGILGAGYLLKSKTDLHRRLK